MSELRLPDNKTVKCAYYIDLSLDDEIEYFIKVFYKTELRKSLALTIYWLHKMIFYFSSVNGYSDLTKYSS